MEGFITLNIEKLEEGGYLATSDEMEDLIAQGDTIAETLEIAKDVAEKLIESYIEHGDQLPVKIKKPVKDSKFVIPVPVPAAA